MGAEELVADTPADGVLRLTLARPERRNALSTPLLSAVAAALVAAAEDEAVRSVLLTGGEKVFAAGADIQEIADRDVQGALGDPRVALWGRIRAFPKPLVAAVSGWCLGAGLELALCCDLIVAGEDARFGAPETSLGIMPGAGGTAVLPRLVGPALAARMVLLGEPISAAEALAAGLIMEVAPPETAQARGLEIAKAAAARAPLALRQAKASLRAALELPLGAHLAFERQAFAALFATRDKAEGVAAFLEKRKPDWVGR